MASIRDSLVTIAPLDGAPVAGPTVIIVIEDGALPVPTGDGAASASASRRLLAATTCSGPLTVGSASVDFDNCVPLTPNLNLYYTLTAAGSGSLLTAGIKAQSNGYAAFAISPDNSGGMVGSNAAIVFPDTSSPTGASVTGIAMKTTNTAALNAAKGSYNIGTTTAAKNADGTLAATFQITLPKPPATYEAAGGLTYLYLTDGPVKGVILDDHTAGNSDYGANVMALKGAATTPTTPTPTAPVTTPTAPVVASPSPTTTPTPTAPVTGEGESEGNGEGEGAIVPNPTTPTSPTENDGNAETGTTVTPSTDTAVTTPPTTDTPTTGATSTTGSTSGGNANCALTVGTETINYQACYDISIGNGLKVSFTFEADPADATSSILSMGLTATSTGYISVGFPTKAGSMTNAGAAILQTCSTCATGASMNEYWMTGTRVSDVQPNTKYGLYEMKASSTNSQLSGSFKMKMSGVSATAARRKLMQTTFTASSYPLIYAVGPVTATGSLLAHTSSNGVGNTMNLLQGVPGSTAANGTVDAGAVDAGGSSYWAAHAWCSTIGWGILVPLAIIKARYFKPHHEYWFHLHRFMAAGGYILATVGLALGFVANGGWDTDKPVHRDLGMAATVLGFLQLFSLFKAIRPSPGAKYRPHWFFIHSWTGRSATILAIANIYYGIINVEELGTWAWAVYTAVLGCIVAFGLVMEVVNWRLASKTVAAAPSKPGAPGSEPISRQDSQQILNNNGEYSSEVELGRA